MEKSPSSKEDPAQPKININESLKKKKKTRDITLPMQGAHVESLVGELRSYMLHSMAIKGKKMHE